MPDRRRSRIDWFWIFIIAVALVPFLIGVFLGVVLS